MHDLIDLSSGDELLRASYINLLHREDAAFLLSVCSITLVASEPRCYGGAIYFIADANTFVEGSNRTCSCFDTFSKCSPFTQSSSTLGILTNVFWACITAKPTCPSLSAHAWKCFHFRATRRSCLKTTIRLFVMRVYHKAARSSKKARKTSSSATFVLRAPFLWCAVCSRKLFACKA